MGREAVQRGAQEALRATQPLLGLLLILHHAELGQAHGICLAQQSVSLCEAGAQLLLQRHAVRHVLQAGQAQVTALPLQGPHEHVQQSRGMARGKHRALRALDRQCGDLAEELLLLGLAQQAIGQRVGPQHLALGIHDHQAVDGCGGEPFRL